MSQNNKSILNDYSIYSENSNDIHTQKNYEPFYEPTIDLQLEKNQQEKEISFSESEIKSIKDTDGHIRSDQDSVFKDNLGELD